MESPYQAFQLFCFMPVCDSCFCKTSLCHFRLMGVDNYIINVQ
nr:MAG TPA: Hepatitis E virus ORF-2 (Putative capsid protein) [Caudoviricetes sp.]